MILRIAQYALLGVLAVLPAVRAQGQNDTSGIRWIAYQTPDDKTIYLDDNRKPALYTQNFGDCLGGSSLINVSRFDAAYYQDNMTVQFHLVGTSPLVNQSIMMYIGVFAYGESRFDLTFNPCKANIYSACPVNSSVPITANGIIPVSNDDVANIPNIALSIPDFEGQAILRVFANDTESEIGCYSAVVTNGATFSQPASVGTILGIFTLVAIIASFATAAYGEAIPTMRLHYAHSLSVGVVFAVFQHIFFTGALSMNWPSVLVAWWSNFAWAGGMIYTQSMQASINNLIGNNIGSTSLVGAAPAGYAQQDLGGGYDITQIYGRGLSAVSRAVRYPANHPLMRNIAAEIYGFDRSSAPQKTAEHVLAARDVIADASSGYKWYGDAVGLGLPLPGNFSGFAGTLAEENIRISNAFMTGFLWFLIAVLIVVGSVVLLKGILEGLSRFNITKKQHLVFFRKHWIRYVIATFLRTCYIAWFMMAFLCIFQFSFQSGPAVKAIAALVFAFFMIGLFGLAYLACVYKGRQDAAHTGGTQLTGKQGLMSKLGFTERKKKRQSITGEKYRKRLSTLPEAKNTEGPFWRRGSSRLSHTEASDYDYSVHDDDDFITKFGWLASRFRRTRWWFFTYYLGYELLRAIFLGGASGSPLVQVFCLLVIELAAFCFVLWAKPFEGRRLNLIVVYCLGISKVLTVALSAAFDVQFNLQRIVTTAVGIIIIVIQGILMIITVIAIVVGACTSYMSISRNTNNFKPRKYAHLRERYFDHLDRVVNDLPSLPKEKKKKKAEAVPDVPPLPPKEPYFEMKNMRRMAKIEDDDPDAILDATDSRTSFGQRPVPPYVDSRPGSETASPVGRTRAASAGSMSLRHGSLPYGARPHKASWSNRDFDSWNRENDIQRTQSPIDMTKNVADDEPVTLPSAPRNAHVRTNSRGSTHGHQLQRSLRRQPDNDPSRNSVDHPSSQPIGRPRASTRGSSAERSYPGMDRTSFDNSRMSDPFSNDAQTVTARRQASGSNTASRQLPQLTPAQESEEFPAYFDHADQRRRPSTQG